MEVHGKQHSVDTCVCVCLCLCAYLCVCVFCNGSVTKQFAVLLLTYLSIKEAECW